MAVNQHGLLQDFSSRVELNKTLSDSAETNMAFPYSQGSRKGMDPIHIDRPTYHYSEVDIKEQRRISNGIGNSDALVENTSINMSPGEVSTYRVEHLASFQHESGGRELSPAAAVKKLNEISEEGGLWSQLMSMKVTDEKLIMANGETMEIIEEYALENISLCTSVTNHPAINNIFIFSTRYSSDKVGAIHLFQCKPNEAVAISSDIERRRVRDKMTSGAVVNGGFSVAESPKLNGHREPTVAVSGDATDNVAKKNLENLGYSHDEHEGPSSPRQGAGVHQRIEAFQKISEPLPVDIVRSTSRGSSDYASKETRQARINRDVEALNRCIEAAEEFIIQLKGMNDAKKKLSIKGPKKSMKKKYENTRSLAKGPREDTLVDMYQKFKYAFNLLGKLKTHITNPNAPELVNYLIVPLAIIVKVLGLETAQNVVSPLLTVAAIDLLTNCLRSHDQNFWKSLGPNWCLPQSAPMFHEKYIPPYTPRFKDGWAPPEIVADERSAAAAKSTAAMVARMKESELGGGGTPTMVLRAVQKFRSLAHEARMRKLADEEKKSLEAKHHYDIPPAVQPLQVQTPSVKKVEETPKKLPAAELKYALVVYDYWAHNNKELTIRAGEKVVIIDDTRRWWLVRNDHNEQGYVPSTVLDIYNPETSSEASSGGDSASSPSSTGAPSLATSVEQSKVDRSFSAEASSPKVVTTKSILTESTQFSNPSSPVDTTPPAVIVTAEEPEVDDKEQQNEPPSFLPPPPPVPVVAPPSSVINKSTVKKDSVKKEVPAESLQVELSAKLQQTSSGTNTLVAAADSVDFFIPLFKSSTADDVTRWLKRMKFEPLTVERLSGVAAKELFKIPENDLVDMLGEYEGKRLYNELQVQTGATTRHKTMTEFQKALLVRMKRQETIQKSVTTHQVVVKPTSGSAALSQEEMQQKFKEQQALIKAQQTHPNPEREPEKHTFSSFQGITVNANEQAASSENA